MGGAKQGGAAPVAGGGQRGCGSRGRFDRLAQLLDVLGLHVGDLAEDPEEEAEELAQLYVERGMDPEQALQMAELLMKNPAVALEVHAREELGVVPGELASPTGAAAWSFVSFAVGALLPLIPWLFGSGVAATWASIVVGVLGAASIGLALAVSTGRRVTANVSRHVLIAVAAAAVTWLIGNALGAAVDL